MRAAILLVLVAACTVEIEGIPITLSSGANGKADSIDGKQLRVRTRAVVDLATLEPAAWQSVDIFASTDTVVVTGELYAVEASESGRTLVLSIEKKLEDERSRLGFLLWDPRHAVPLTCTRGDVRLNYFERLAIRPADKTVLANDGVTFTYAECGVTSSAFEVFPLPVETVGRLRGTYEFRLRTELK